MEKADLPAYLACGAISLSGLVLILFFGGGPQPAEGFNAGWYLLLVGIFGALAKRYLSPRDANLRGEGADGGAMVRPRCLATSRCP